jgi:hypothetical protein
MTTNKIKGNQLKTKKTNPTTFDLGGITYKMSMDFNVMTELEEVYGDINKAFEDLQAMKIKAIRAVIYAIVKVEDETKTLKEVGAMLDINFMEEFAKKMGLVMADAMPEKEDEDEDDEPKN